MIVLGRRRILGGGKDRYLPLRRVFPVSGNIQGAGSVVTGRVDMADSVDPIELAAKLVRCPSVTPAEAGALSLLRECLRGAGFECHRVDRGGIGNLFARWGPRGHPRTFGFNGHTDVVPVGERSDWTVDAFAGEIRDGWLWGRGAADMKSGVAAFAAAAIDLVREAPPDGAVIMAITGDEEGDAVDGTVALLEWMAANGEKMSVCVVGEPTSRVFLGDTIKIGRRGSLTADFSASGIQGHSAYPHLAKNPVHALVKLMDRLVSHRLDGGTAFFDPSSLAVTTVDTGNPADNVIPATCRARVNVRFGDAHSSDSLGRWLRTEADLVADVTGVAIKVDIRISGESFVTAPGELSDLVAGAIAVETGNTPEHSTSGGTSDSRFVKDHCPVVEFGLVGRTMHQVDERVETAEITALKAIYRRMLDAYFA